MSTIEVIGCEQERTDTGFFLSTYLPLFFGDQSSSSYDEGLKTDADVDDDDDEGDDNDDGDQELASSTQTSEKIKPTPILDILDDF